MYRAMSVTMAVIMAIVLVGCQSGGKAQTGKEIRIAFAGSQAGKLPDGFATDLTHEGQPGRWAVVRDGSQHVLAQFSTDPTKARYPLCIYSGANPEDVSVRVRFKAVDGKVDQAAGLVARYQDKNNYYVVRANAIESNTRLYKVQAGKRILIADANMTVTAGEWHELKFDVVGTQQRVFYDGNQVIAAQDVTFTGPGKVGMWTKADSVTYFDALVIRPLK